MKHHICQGVDWDRKGELGHQVHAWRDKYICFVWLSDGVLSVFSPICPTLPRSSVLLIPTLIDQHTVCGGSGQTGWIGTGRVDWDKKGRLS
jgi:hypothetical protein